MTHVVTEICMRRDYTICIEGCPADCFHDGRKFLTNEPSEYLR